MIRKNKKIILLSICCMVMITGFTILSAKNTVREQQIFQKTPSDKADSIKLELENVKNKNIERIEQLKSEINASQNLTRDKKSTFIEEIAKIKEALKTEEVLIYERGAIIPKEEYEILQEEKEANEYWERVKELAIIEGELSDPPDKSFYDIRLEEFITTLRASYNDGHGDCEEFERRVEEIENIIVNIEKQYKEGKKSSKELYTELEDAL